MDVSSAAATGDQSVDQLATVDAASGGPGGVAPSVSGVAELTDVYTIGAGSSGLANGDPVKVRLRARFTGSMQL